MKWRRNLVVDFIININLEGPDKCWPWETAMQTKKINESDLCECGHLASLHYYNNTLDNLDGGCMLRLYEAVTYKDEIYCPCMAFKSDRFIELVRLANEKTKP